MDAELSGWQIAGIIILVLGVIVSNLMVLRYSAKLKWPKREDLVDPTARAKKQAQNQSEPWDDDD